MISDVTMRSLESALHGLTARRQAAEDNVANVETPGYLAKKVSFEDSLRSAIDRGRPSAATTTVSSSSDPTRLNGNNVNIDEEMVGLTETGLRQQLVVQALNAKYALLRTSIMGR